MVAVGGACVDGEARPVVAAFVVPLHGCEGQLRRVSVYHDEDRVVRFVVAFVAVSGFDVGVHDACLAVSAHKRFSHVSPSVSATALAASVNVEDGAVIQCDGGGHFVVADGDVGDVAAFQEGGVFFRGAVFVEDGQVVGGHVMLSHFCLSCCGGVSRSFVAAVYARVAAPRRTVRVKPVPYAPGPSSPCAVRRGSWVSFPSIMTKMVYFSHPSLMSFSLHVYSTRAFMMREVLLPR